MPDTGFQDRQWLVRRDGRLLQVTELLYRVAEQADGKRTLEEIAQAVTEATEGLLDADAVRRLIQAKLLPLSRVARADDAGGLVATTPGGVGAGPSPLALNLRMRTLSPRLVEPVSRMLRVLHAPLIVLPVLAGSGLAHWWLYRGHGFE